VIAATGKPVVMHQGTGHDMIFLPGLGERDGEPARHSVHGAPRCRAFELQRRARASP